MLLEEVVDDAKSTSAPCCPARSSFIPSKHSKSKENGHSAKPLRAFNHQSVDVSSRSDC